MPVRIYALAKELNLDSKDLVLVCQKAGIPGKGSALASLDDDEVVKVKNYLGGGDKKSDQYDIALVLMLSEELAIFAIKVQGL